MTEHHCPGCQCDRTLTEDDLTNMFAAGKYEEINAAHAAGRFKFNDTNQ